MDMLAIIAASRRRSVAYDSDVSAFATASGATDLTVLNNLTLYLKAQSLWTSCRIFPFKSAQNKGSGTTVYGLGGWTSNNIATIGGPTWGASGMAFDATDDRGTWDATGIAGLAELYTFDVQKPTNASMADILRFGVLSFGLVGATNTFWLDHGVSGAISGETTAQGISNVTAKRNGTDDITWTASERLQIVSRYAQTDSGMWKSKTSAVMDKNAPTPGTIPDLRPSTAGWATNSTLHVSATYDGSSYQNFAATTRVALLACKTAITQTQRETITDYLDAL